MTKMIEKNENKPKKWACCASEIPHVGFFDKIKLNSRIAHLKFLFFISHYSEHLFLFAWYRQIIILHEISLWILLIIIINRNFSWSKLSWSWGLHHMRWLIIAHDIAESTIYFNVRYCRGEKKVAKVAQGEEKNTAVGYTGWHLLHQIVKRFLSIH